MNVKNFLCLLSLTSKVKLSSKLVNVNAALVRQNSTKMKYLNVAEKNDAAKNIALQLSRGTSRRREGLSQYNKIYEFEAEVNGVKCDMVMTSVSGHLLALEFVGNYKHWQSCSPLSLFEAPVFKYCPDNYVKIKQTLEREIRGCQGLIIWTDCDREGENIGYEVIDVCTAVKNNIQVYRAKFSEITAISVRRALQNLERPNKNVSDAVDVRQELDLRIGAAFTRFQTLRLQKVFPTKLAESLVSYGSCQFPTLGFVVERYRAVENFVAEPFWKIKVNHTMNNLSIDFSWDRVRLFDRDATTVLHEICLDSPLATVCDVKTKPKSKWRPLPLDTVELEKLASRKLKINAKETMRLAEKLYTQGFISYPRTETNEYPKEMNLAQLVGLHTGDPNWGTFAQRILDNGGPNPRQGNKSDKAHPPIHPTKHATNLSGNEARLYEFIVRSFLACSSKDAQGQETTVAIDVAGEKFSASGLMITERNYLEVYPYDKWSAKEIHVYESGQTFTPTSIDMVDGSTSPPNLLTEADLIALMEKHGIGTDATHAEHIETIKNRSYVALADAIHFVPGLLGMGLVEGYDAMGLNISKPHLRAQLEADLKAICEGRKQPQVVLAEQIAKYKEVYLTVTAEANKIDEALGIRFSERPAEYTPSTVNSTANMPSVFKCPKCGSEMVVKQKKNNPEEYYVSCVSYPNCKNALWLPTFVRNIEVLPETCPQCGPNYKKVKFQWKNNSMNHLYPPPFTTCIGGCDTTFLDYMNINLSTVRNAPNNRRNNQVPVNDRVPPNVPNTNNNRLNDGMNNPFSTGRQNERPNSTNNLNTARPNDRTNSTNIQSSVRQNDRMNSTNNPFSTASQIERTNSTNSTRPFVPPAPANPFTGTRISGSNSEADPESNNVFCSCDKPAILLTVKKQTANFGKKFYKCQTRKEEGGCDFFLWAPENLTESTSSPPTSGYGSQTSRGWGIAPRNDFSNDDDVKCQCGIAAKKITVHKEGPNKGRNFYSCSKDYNSRCKFFQWADEGSSASVEWGESSRPERGRGRGGRGGTGGGGGGRKCGLCKQPGHTRNRCPQNE